MGKGTWFPNDEYGMVLELTAFQDTPWRKGGGKTGKYAQKNPQESNFLLCSRAKQEKERLGRRNNRLLPRQLSMETYR
jgi:hypothetical protein